MDAQLKKGFLELCLLAIISREEQYGYDIIRRMQGYFPETNESSFYAILRRLRREGVLEQFPGTQSEGPPRKYYRITDSGRDTFRKQAADWHRLTDIMRELGVE